MTTERLPALIEDTASYTAFIYAGALQSPAMDKDPQIMESYGGHTGFVWYATQYAHAITQWIIERVNTENEDWPGVIQYELFEPMGEWLLTLEPPTIEEVLEKFETEYITWIAKSELERS